MCVGKVKTKSKRIDAEFLLNYGRSSRERKKLLKLIRFIGEGKTVKEASSRLHFSKQRSSYWIRKAVRDGLLRVLVDGRPKFYELTAFGQKYLTGSERGFREPCTIEDYAMKFSLLADRSSIDWKKLGEPKNWRKMGIKLGSITVEKTSRSIIIHAGQLTGFYYEDLFIEAGAIIQLVRAKLLDLGVETGETGIPIRDVNFKLYTPEAEYLHEKYGNIQTPEGIIDASPPDKVPHEERNRRQQRTYLDMPRRIRNIESDLQEIRSNQTAIVQTQEDLAAATKEQTEVLKNLTKFLSGAVEQASAPEKSKSLERLYE
jgi:hypothetical protein